MQINVEWNEFKQFVDNRDLSIQYIEFSDVYVMYVVDGSLSLHLKMQKQSEPAENSDQYVFEQNYKASANKPLVDKDDTNREVVRIASTDKSWAFKFHCLEITTAKQNGFYSKNWKRQNAFHNHIYKFYDDNNNEVIASSATRSVLTIDLGTDFDIIAGSIMQHKRPTNEQGDLQDVRIYTTIGIVDTNGNPFDPDGPGTSWSEQVVEFVGGINLKFVTDNGEIETDGRSGKKLFKVVNPAVPYNQNQMQIIIDHPAGFQHDIQISMQYYRQP